MHGWDAGQYLRFADERTRPALDLLAQIDLAAPRRIVDLGCGPGNSTGLLRERWPAAAITGLDTSADMLDAARRDHPGIDFVAGDIAAWSPAEPYDLVFSNAALQWVGDHERLLPRLIDAVNADGVLAVQMPRNHESPSHRLMREAAEAGPWRSRLQQVRAIAPVAESAAYHRLLASLAGRLEIWETEYLHCLSGRDPVVEWTRGTGLRPYLDRLAGAERDGFLAAYTARVAAAYPAEPDGTTLFPFRRIFIVAARAAAG